MSHQNLLDIVRKYDLPVDPSAIRSLLADEEQGRVVSEWIKSCLTTDTLLTKDELNSYATRISNISQLLLTLGQVSLSTT